MTSRPSPRRPWRTRRPARPRSAAAAATAAPAGTRARRPARPPGTPSSGARRAARAPASPSSTPGLGHKGAPPRPVGCLRPPLWVCRPAMADLEGKRVLITGASSGIGFAAAHAFAQAGADVALTARGEEGLRKAAEAARAQGAHAVVIPADLADRAQAQRVVAEAVEALGGLDVLAWCAASMVFGTFADVEPEDYDRTTAVTYTAAVNTVRAALPHLEASGGTIVVTGSIMAKVPLPTFGSYAAAKHALRGFLGSLRIELLEAGSPVTVSMGHPGAVDTPLWGHVTSADGTQPRNPPDLYAPEVMANALVACAIDPRAEITVGLEARAIEGLFTFARPLADRVLTLVNKYYASGTERASEPGMHWRSADEGRASGGLHGRPSLWGALRLGLRLLPPYSRGGATNR